MKALPQPSKKYGETVCCAGITPDGHWKRLYPIRFRHLAGDTSFGRWQTIRFRFRPPMRDKRAESCNVEEDSIEIVGAMPSKEQSRFLDPLVLPSVAEIERRRQSLGLIRPREPRFFYKRKSPVELAEEKAAYVRAARQGSLLDNALEALDPTPYKFKFQFSDAEHPHIYTNGDWEAHAMFYNGRRRGQSEAEVLEWMEHTFNVEYRAKGMVFAVGNQAKRPHVWQLLGVIRLNELSETEKAQASLF
ncbi:hypothetical protein [Mesorhizobium sp. YM1C-6-2]|uniref:hypothetical protein n=1 Tax=Mesorhizobium sp. YM1C-6-2 TaxID=1827501 RepID=UPI001FE2194B|nr:hypothetical protein [Mesorhizobium sp. YM1C-6-2]